MFKKLLLLVLLLLLVVPVAFADFVELERVLTEKVNIQTDMLRDTIREEGETSRSMCEDWVVEVALEQEQEIRSVLWLDRALTFGLVFFAVLAGGAFNRYLSNKREIQKKEISKLEVKANGRN